jgi:hypothetical protein
VASRAALGIDLTIESRRRVAPLICPREFSKSKTVSGRARVRVSGSQLDWPFSVRSSSADVQAQERSFPNSWPSDSSSRQGGVCICMAQMNTSSHGAANGQFVLE